MLRRLRFPMRPICLGTTFAALFLAASLLAETKPHPPSTPQKTVYDYSLVGLEGKEVSLASYRGKVLLIVNLQNDSIYKEQLAGLEDLQKTYKDKGLVVLGIPSCDFGGEDAAKEADPQKIYVADGHVSFPVFSRASLRGKDEIPLYAYLTDPKGAASGEVHWSYTKFLVDRAGKVATRFELDVEPNDPEFLLTIEKVLAGTFKGKAAKGGGDKDQAADRDDSK